ncbi:sensor histidine kinase [Tellurirhabdus rosea]|uniref:sensor histidine kinase n=1 Tax=Tellurirhabdus rosea TaxID=2674997 RepID=UPI00224F49FE|nr:sensor histidine kinase [Tellurirhabdus rosea]
MTSTYVTTPTKDRAALAPGDTLPLQRPLNHILFWHFYILIAYLALWFGPSKPLFADVYAHQVLGISLIYVEALFVLPTWYRKGRYIQLLLAHVAVLVVYSLLRFLLNEGLAALTSERVFSEAKLGNVWLIGLYVWVLFTTLGVGYYYALDSIAKKDELLRLQRLTFEIELEAIRTKTLSQALERDKARAELAHLRAQINPHFLFNTLNFLYAKARQSSRELAEAIMILSEMMQYTVSHSDADDQVPVSGELHYLRNYLQLQKIRFEDTVSIALQIEDRATSAQQIIPLVLITFVENAFKYGDLHEPTQPLTVEVENTDERLFFRCFNKIRRNGLPERSSGIGLANVRQRLSAQYAPGRYRLDLHQTEQTFEVIFTLFHA